jgi:glyoxylase-like metal-dependent hydrolase (beta-lactamase superfamily II)
MKLGDFELEVVSDGYFWLDGGSMYGSVPKALWSKLTPADPQIRIRLSINCLLVKAGGKTVLVDTGIGDRLSNRLKEIYKVERHQNLHSSLAAFGVAPGDIDFIINTHLHFDHCGGNTVKQGDAYAPAFPNATYVIQKEEWRSATNTNEKTRASYRSSDFLPVQEAGQLLLIDGEHEVVPGVSAIATSGHTRGHQSVFISSGGNHAFYLGDLIPTAYHLKMPYLTGFDLYPVELLDTKRDIIDRAVEQKWLLIFEHDPETIFAYITREDSTIKVIPA